MPTNPDRQATESQRPDAASHAGREWMRVALSCIGEAVVTTDADGGVTFLNPLAQSLTGWTQEEAVGVPLENVLRIVDGESRQAVESPAARALRDGDVGWANHTLLTSRDGTERPIDDRATPFRDERGDIAGAVIVFRDLSERRRLDRVEKAALTHAEETRAYAEEVIATLREPFVVLDKGLRVKTANAAAPGAHPAPSGSAESPAHSGRVLLVDDNVDSTEILAKLLRHSGHDVRTAYTGPTALEAAVAHPPDVVLLDIGLPGLNGYEVARRLRQYPQLKGVRLVAMTGYGQESDLQLAREAGFDSHLLKPVDFLKVKDLLTTLLASPSSGG